MNKNFEINDWNKYLEFCRASFAEELQSVASDWLDDANKIMRQFSREICKVSSKYEGALDLSVEFLNDGRLCVDAVEHILWMMQIVIWRIQKKDLRKAKEMIPVILFLLNEAYRSVPGTSLDIAYDEE